MLINDTNRKELAKYLADYIEHERDAKKEEYDFDTAVEFVFENLSDYISDGLEAYESIFISPSTLTFKIICPVCNTALEVEDGTDIECGNCQTVLNDKGIPV